MLSIMFAEDRGRDDDFIDMHTFPIGSSAVCDEGESACVLGVGLRVRSIPCSLVGRK
jgi:hypothetical protein